MEIKKIVEIINSKAALNLAVAAIESGNEKGVAVSVAVCDPFMNEILFIKTDGATPHSALTSRRKASTAASTKRPTGWMNDELAISLPLAAGNVLTNIGGGIPIKVDGAIIGAIGIAGGTVDQDIEIAKAALNKFGADPCM